MREGNGVGEGGSGAEALEEVGGFGHEGEAAEGAGGRRFVPIQVFLPRKKLILVEEMRLRRMKKGQDMSRSRLISEAIDLFVERETGVKSGGRED